MVFGYRAVVTYNHQNITTDDFCSTVDSLTKAGIKTDIFSGVMEPVMNCINYSSLVSKVFAFTGKNTFLVIE